jgi:hypothetical protein
MLDYDDEEYYIMNSMDFIKTLNDGFILVADLKLNTYLSIYYDEKNNNNVYRRVSCVEILHE